MTNRAARRLLALVVICIVCAVVAILSGCGGGASPPVKGGEVEVVDGGVKITLPKGTMLPKAVTVTTNGDEQKYVPPAEANWFPVGPFLSWLIPGAGLCVAALLLGGKEFTPIIAGGSLVLATAMAVGMLFWEILWSLLCLAVIAALVFGVMRLRRSRMLKELVGQLQTKRDTDEVFKAAMNGAVKLEPATTKVVDKMRGK